MKHASQMDCGSAASGTSYAGLPSMLQTGDRRSVYRGPLPGALERNLGGHNLYFSVDRPFRFRRGDECWQEARVAIATPYDVHSVCSGSASIMQILIEEKDVARDSLPHWMCGDTGVISNAVLATQLRDAGAKIQLGTGDDFVDSLDILLFGRPLLKRKLDDRVAHVVGCMAALPGERHAAADCAKSVNLSPSRFLHLFKAEVGTPFRRYRAWKRAHGLLESLARGGNLVEIALDAGYSDSAHFSHSVRNVYGNCPSQIMASLRRVSTPPQQRPQANQSQASGNTWGRMAATGYAMA